MWVVSTIYSNILAIPSGSQSDIIIFDINRVTACYRNRMTECYNNTLTECYNYTVTESDTDTVTYSDTNRMSGRDMTLVQLSGTH